MKCPKCASENVTHSHRRGMEKIVRYVYPRVPYRCKECWTRFWKFENPLKTLASKAMLILFILLVAGACVWFFSSSEEEQPPPLTQKKSRPIKKPIPQMTVGETDTAKTEVSGKTEIAKQEEGKDYAKNMTPDSGRPSEPEKGTDEPAELPVETPAELPAFAEKSEAVAHSETPAEKSEAVAHSETPAEKSETVAHSETSAEKSEAVTQPAEKASEAQSETPAENTEASAAQPETPAENTEASAAQSETSAEKTEASAAQSETASEPVATAKKPKHSAKKKTRRTLNLQHQSSADEFRLELLSDGPIQEYKPFTITSPPKLVVDLPGKWRYSGRYTVRVKSDMVRRVRVGRHSDKLRLVLDMKTKMSGSPVFEESSDGLAVIIKK